jgi:hypothetical protein
MNITVGLVYTIRNNKLGFGHASSSFSAQKTVTLPIRLPPNSFFRWISIHATPAPCTVPRIALPSSLAISNVIPGQMHIHNPVENGARGGMEDAQAKDVFDHGWRNERSRCCEILEIGDVRPVVERRIQLCMYAVAFIVVGVSD